MDEFKESYETSLPNPVDTKIFENKNEIYNFQKFKI